MNDRALCRLCRDVINHPGGVLPEPAEEWPYVDWDAAIRAEQNKLHDELRKGE